MFRAAQKSALIFSVILIFSTFLPASSIQANAADYQRSGTRQQGKRIHAVATASLPQASPNRTLPGWTGTLRERVSPANRLDAGCGFNTPCYSVIRAPEPQSLLLVGSGLITMAGLIRRRVAR